MSASPITPSDLDPVTDGATACDHLTELGNTRAKMQEFLEWLLTDDANGNLGSGFKEALVQQMLFDSSKKGYLVMSDETSGYLTLVQKLLLSKLSVSGVTAGDYMIASGSGDSLAWAKQTPIYLAPTSGGTTVPDPDTGGILSVAHGFSSAPKNFRGFIECNSTDAGYAVSDRLDIHSLMQRGSGGEIRKAVTLGVDSTLIFAVFVRDGSSARKYCLPNKASTWGVTDIDPSKWSVKFWALP